MRKKGELMGRDDILRSENISKLSYETQKQKLRFFVRLELVIKLQIFQNQTKIFHKLRQNYIDDSKEMLSYIAFILAIDEEIGQMDIVNLNAVKLKSRQFRRRAKREKLLSYWAIIKTLRVNEKMSFRQISEYLLKYHKLAIAHSTIFNLWCEIEKEDKNG